MLKVKGYIFISNSEKPSLLQMESLDPISINSFDEASLYAARQLGYKLFEGISRNHPEKIVCSTPGYEVLYYNQHIYRNIFAINDNYKAYKNACDFLREHPEIEIIHCNTPIGGVVGRLVGKKYGKKIIYTVHGFHFYKGAPLLNWLLFYPIEKFLLKYTDVLITINKEDFQRAKDYKLRNGGKVYYIPGVGIDVTSVQLPINARNDMRSQLGIPLDAILIISVGRLDKNKNHAFTINAVSKMRNKEVHLLICGEGDQRKNLEYQIKKLKLTNRVHLLGNRTDVMTLYSISDIFALSSLREGLSRSIMEAMSAGLPCVVTKIRGNTDLIENGKGGYCVPPRDVSYYANHLDILSYNKSTRQYFSEFNLRKIIDFSKEVVKQRMLEIFKNEL